jgi:hypothetical protein
MLLARCTEAFDFRKLPKDLRVAIDSSPLEGAGCVEDTVNLLAHPARMIVDQIPTVAVTEAAAVSGAAPATTLRPR